MEGYLGFCLSSFAVLVGVYSLLDISVNWRICLAIMFTGLEELVCEEIDNYVLPMYFLSLVLFWN